MKTLSKLFAAFLTLSVIFAEEAPKKEKHAFESTYAEGFGRIFQKEMTIKKIPKDPRMKAGMDRYYLVVPGEKEVLVTIEGWNDEIQEQLEQVLATKTIAKVLAAGYESIESRGSPGLSQSAPKEATEWIPQDYGWHVEKVIYLMSIKVIQPDSDKPDKK